jgi:2-(1,2-epoxy-1,2-dihydrophenyl)acetyl-CoA isomerase
MENKSALYELEQSVARITLNRPDVLNSFNRPMAKGLQAILKEIAENPDVRALLLTGSGRAFCAGQDLVEALPSGEDLPTDIGEIVEQSYNPIIRGICYLEKPVVCAVNGGLSIQQGLIHSILLQHCARTG